MTKVSLIIPTYFNQESVTKLKTDLIFLKENLLKKNIFLQIIFIDDASEDSTLKKIEEISSDFDYIIVL